ncbi:hypothetical protein ACLKA6_004582 [Drosophila palustris]
MADESRATVYKALVATVQLGDSCACIPFLVLLTIVDDVILGIDFLCAAPHCTTPSGIVAFKSKLTFLLINDPPYVLDTTNDIDIAAKDLVGKIHTAGAASMVNHRNVLPLGPPRAPLKPEILRRRWMRTRHPLEFKAATDVLRKAPFEAKSEFFVEKLRAIDPNQNRGFALWKCTRGLKRQPVRRFSLLRRDGTWARSDLEIAEEFATDLSERFTPFDLASDEEVLATTSYAGVVPGPSVPIRQIDVPEVVEQIKRLKPTKAPGHDGLDVNECKSAWASLRDSLRYHRSKLAKSGSAGGIALGQPRVNENIDWQFAEHMAFLPVMSLERRTKTSTTMFVDSPVGSPDACSSPLLQATEENQMAASSEEPNWVPTFDDFEASTSSAYSYVNQPFAIGIPTLNAVVQAPKTRSVREEVIIPEIIRQVRQIVLTDRRVKVREIAETVGISTGSAVSILHDHLHMKKLNVKWVPHFLDIEQREKRVADSKSCLDMFNRNPREFLLRYITMDDTWIHHYIPESNRSSAEWREAGESRSKRVMASRWAERIGGDSRVADEVQSYCGIFPSQPTRSG